MNKVIVNATTLVVGGGIQVGISFIEQAIRNNEFKWLFLVSTGIYNNLSKEIKIDSRIICINTSPSKIISGYKSRTKIKQIVNDFNPDLIYSIGFPSYIRFKKPELGRYTNPWEINTGKLPWHTIPGFFNRVKIRLGILYRTLWARRADYLETQTESAQIGISKRVFYPFEKVFVIPNSPNSIFLKNGDQIINIDEIFKRDNVAFCIAAPYKHKNLEIIPLVANILKFKNKLSVKFVLTLPKDSNIWLNILSKANELNVNELIINIGPIKVSECVDFYNQSKIVFLPTLLEVFSATYLEAMAMKVPIITTDLDFAHDNCKQAALFYQPEDANDAANVIYRLINDKSLFFNQIKKGTEVLKTYPTLDEKYSMLFNHFKTIIKNEN